MPRLTVFPQTSTYHDPDIGTCDLFTRAPSPNVPEQFLPPLPPFRHVVIISAVYDLRSQARKPVGRPHVYSLPQYSA